MRKEDRMRQEVNRGEHDQPFNRTSSSTQKKDQERMRGSASTDEAVKPPRQQGKMPLPE